MQGCILYDKFVYHQIFCHIAAVSLINITGCELWEMLNIIKKSMSFDLESDLGQLHQRVAYVITKLG